MPTNMLETPGTKEHWPELPLARWKQTCDTLHMWTQIVGKIRLKSTPYINHWWEVVLYVTSRGLTTSPMPYVDGSFEIDFDFLDHSLLIETSAGESRTMALEPRSVANFYQELMAHLGSLGIDIQIDPMPVEVPNPIAFPEDDVHKSYDQDAVERFFKNLSHADRVLKKFRSGFIGKCSPVHFYWGSFDLAVTRFSGRRAPERPEADHATRLAYSHEVLSCGFWPGGGNIDGPAFYAYAAPEPQGYGDGMIQRKIRPPSAFYSAALKNFILMVDEVRRAEDPDQMILDFLQSTYDLGADLGKWDRQALERKTFLSEEANKSRAA
jgi:hypothetical protein